MRKLCDVCGQELGLQRFKYKEGFICKGCYQKASKNYSETISQKSKAEIMTLCKKQDLDDENWGNFERTRKIGSYILFDDKHNSFCITHNRLTEKDGRKAEILQYDDLKKVELYCEPGISREMLADMVKCRKETVIKVLEIRVWTYSERDMKRIVLLSTPVRVMSFAFRRVFAFAERILDELEKIITENETRVEKETEGNAAV